MSRLDSMLRRFTAQRDGLNWAASDIAGLAGDVVDFGLGNGRTYDHLREILPDRRIWVVDRTLQCHPSCIPPEEDFLMGEAEEVLDDLAARGVKVALAHYDLGHGDKAHDVAESLLVRATNLFPAVDVRHEDPGANDIREAGASFLQDLADNFDAAHSLGVGIALTDQFAIRPHGGAARDGYERARPDGTRVANDRFPGRSRRIIHAI